MISVELKAKPKVKKWLKLHNINFKVVEKCLNIFLNSIRNFDIPDTTQIQIINCDHLSSGYYFGFNELHITEHIDQNGWSREKKIDTFVCHLLHEMRHWIQDHMLEVDECKLNYTDEDCEKSRPKYYYNKYEVDARKFERRYKKEFIQLYNVLHKLNQKPDLN